MSLNSISDIGSLQAYNGINEVAFVSDPLRGGTFYYHEGTASYKNTFSFQKATGATKIVDSATNLPKRGFKIGQQITVKFPATDDTDDILGVYEIINITGNPNDTLYISPAIPDSQLGTQEAEIIINYQPYSASVAFDGLTLTESSATGFFSHGFLPGQTIYISSASADYNGIYVVDTITKLTATTAQMKVIGKAFPVSSSDVSCTISLQDDGTIFDATGKGHGYWERDFNPENGLNVTWFGAMGNAFYRNPDRQWFAAHDFKLPANDDTASIQRALNVAVGNKQICKKVVIPPGMYLHNTLYVPTGVLLTGVGAITESLNVATSKLVMKFGGSDSIRVIDTGVDHGDSIRRYWYGGICNLEFLGEPNNSTGWAISFADNATDTTNKVIAPQDMNFFENLQMRGYPQGGINFPDCAVPLNVRNIKASVLGGPAIYLGNTRGSSYGQSLNFDNVSCDHNVGGGIWLDKLNDTTNVIITNLKSEAGQSTAIPGQPNAQPNAIVCSDCDGTPIFINGANHQNTASDVGKFKGNPTLSLSETPIALGSANYFIIVNLPDHGLSLNNKVKFTTNGVLPSVIGWSTTYYVAPIDGDNFKISGDEGGTALNIDTAHFIQSGIHSLYTDFSDGPHDFMKPGDLISIETKLATSPVFTIGSADIALTGTALAIGDTIKFYTNGTLPANITKGQIYYVLAVSTGTFRIATTLDGSPEPVVPAGTQSDTHYIYKQVTSGKLPSLSFVASTIRVRDGDHGKDPVMIAKTGIAYTTTDAAFNITKQFYKDTALVGNESSVNYADDSTVVFESGSSANFENNSQLNLQNDSLTSFENGSQLNLQSGSLTNFKSGSLTSFESGSQLNLQSGSLTSFKSGSAEVFDAGAMGIQFYNTTDQVTNYDQAFLKYADNTLQLATQAGGTRASRPIKISSNTADPTKSTAALTINRAAGPLFLFDLTSTSGAIGTKFTPFARFKAGMSGDSGMQLFNEIAPSVSQTSTAGYTALLVNTTEVSVGSGDKRLIAAQVGSADKFIVDNTGTVTASGDIKVVTAGKGIYVKEGSNATMGLGTLSAGSLTIVTNKVTANSRIFLTIQEGNVANLGNLYIQARTTGTSFTVKSSNTADACTFSWLIVEPA